VPVFILARDAHSRSSEIDIQSRFGLDKAQVDERNIGPGLRRVMVFPRGLGQTEIGLWAIFR
jgi:hypothetical protein